jgi:regulator of sigma E protease
MVGWYVIGALGLALLMVIHEGGHFFAARAYGMRVTKFSIGFGPTFFKVVPAEGYYWFITAGGRVRLRMWGYNREKPAPHTVYQVAMIPFLAYVQIAGMNPLDEIEPDDKGSYANASLMGRIVAIFSGPLANYVFASVFFFLSIYFGGKAIPTTEVNVIDGSPAAVEAKLESGDKIVEIDGVAVSEWDKMAEIIAKHPGQTLALVVERAGERVATSVTPEDKGGRGLIGVKTRAKMVPVSASEAAVFAVETPPRVVTDLVVSLGQLVRGRVEGELSGPVGIVKQAAEVARSGWLELFSFLGVMSAYLGAFNLIPFPALDGGRLMFLGYEAMTRRRPNARIEAHVHAIGLMMMLGLMVYVTINDFGVGPK